MTPTLDVIVMRWFNFQHVILSVYVSEFYLLCFFSNNGDGKYLRPVGGVLFCHNLKFQLQEKNQNTTTSGKLAQPKGKS
jgi:hypothetical protein